MRENIVVENILSEFKINIYFFRFNRVRLDKILYFICYVLYNIFDVKEEFRIW